MKKLNFWMKISNYSIIVCGVILVIKMFFKKYLEPYSIQMFFVSGISLTVFLISELMKFIFQKKNYE
jgi:hypothetical protein